LADIILDDVSRTEDHKSEILALWLAQLVSNGNSLFAECRSLGEHKKSPASCRQRRALREQGCSGSHYRAATR